MDPSQAIIVIGRQYGAGGRDTGRYLASRFSLPYYDKELMSHAAERLGMRADIFSGADEKRPSLLSALVGASYGASSYFYSGGLHGTELYQLQSEVVNALMDQGPCVIVGRTADYLGRERRNLVSVFLHAGRAERVRRVLERHPDLRDEAAAASLMEKMDSKRSNYYNYFTGRRWGYAATYDLCLCSSRLPGEAIGDILETYIRTAL